MWLVRQLSPLGWFIFQGLQQVVDRLVAAVQAARSLADAVASLQRDGQQPAGSNAQATGSGIGGSHGPNRR